MAPLPCSGILFWITAATEPVRMTRKITAAAASIAAGSRERLALGKLAIRRDWGWAPDYVEAMWRMLQSDAPTRSHPCRARARLAAVGDYVGWGRVPTPRGN
jgi:GDP-D-mannose dehydratase